MPHSRRPGRAAAGVLLLMGLWVLVYWLTPPSRRGLTALTNEGSTAGVGADSSDGVRSGSPGITFGAAPQHAQQAVPPRPSPSRTPAPYDALPAAPVQPEFAPVEPPVFREHVLGDDETFPTLARDAYGDPARWGVIARANPRVDPLRLRSGTTVRIPLDPDNVQGKPIDRTQEGHASPAPAVTGTDARGPVPPSAIEYTVRKGDTLTAISAAYYGTTAQWRRIRDANPGIDEDGKNIAVGQKLQIPPLPRR